jgi:hypothetical protein
MCANSKIKFETKFVRPHLKRERVEHGQPLVIPAIVGSIKQDNYGSGQPRQKVKPYV